MTRNRSGSLIEDLVKDLKEISTGKDEFDLRFIRPKKASVPPSAPRSEPGPGPDTPQRDGPIVGAYRRLEEQGRFWDRDMTGTPANVTPFENDPDVVSCIEQPHNSTPTRRCYKVLDRFGKWSERFVPVSKEPPPRPVTVSSLGQRILREAEEAIRPHMDEIVAPLRRLFGENPEQDKQIPLDFRPGGVSRQPGVEILEDANKDWLPCDDQKCPSHPVPGRTHSWVTSRAPGEWGREYCNWCGTFRQ